MIPVKVTLFGNGVFSDTIRLRIVLDQCGLYFSDWCPCEKREEDHVTTEVEIGRMQLQAQKVKDFQSPLYARKRHGWILS